MQTINQDMFSDFYSFLVQIYISLKSASMDAVNISGIFACFFSISCEKSSTEETGVQRNGFNCETI